MSDFNIYFYIWNKTRFPMSLQATYVDDASQWVTSPPATIAPSAVLPTTACAQANAESFMEGSFAGAEYVFNFEDGAQTLIRFHAKDPYTKHNSFDLDLCQKVDEAQPAPELPLTDIFPAWDCPDIVGPTQIDVTVEGASGSAAGPGDWQPQIPTGGHPLYVLLIVSETRQFQNWMSETPGIDGKTLMDLCLPRTHDSGAYALTTNLAPELDAGLRFLRYIDSPEPVRIDLMPDWLSTALGITIRGGKTTLAMQKKLDALITATLTDWGTATNRTILGQLNDGIRMLDLRICRDDNGDFRIHHSLTGPLMTEILEQIRAFVTTASAELVIISASHMFTGHEIGFTEPQHQELMAMITSALAGHLLPSSAAADVLTTPLGSLLSDGKGGKTTKVIFAYSPQKSDITGPIPPSLWKASGGAAGPDGMWLSYPDVEDKDPDKRYAADLVDLNDAMNKPGMFRLDLVLTPNEVEIVPDVIRRIYNQSSSSLRRFEIGMAPRLRPFLIALTQAQRDRINGILVDFEEQSETVPLAVALSRREPIV